MAHAVLYATAVWHFLAFWHFTFHPARTLARTTDERPVSVLATELFRFLGGMNLALVVLPLAATRLDAGSRWPVFASLAVANASQLVVDLRVRGMKLARGPFFFQILVGDAVFTVANAAALVLAP